MGGAWGWQCTLGGRVCGAGLGSVATLAAIALVSVLAALDQTVVATALPHMIAELHGAAILGWVFTAYFLSATATVAVAGKLADLFGRRGVFMVSVGIFLAGSLLSGLADSMLWLVVFRAVQGVGAGSINTLSFIVMGDLFSARERGKWQAVNNIGFATASAIGPRSAVCCRTTSRGAGSSWSTCRCAWRPSSPCGTGCRQPTRAKPARLSTGPARR